MTTLAVLFDFDGVIADTENVHVAAWERTFASMGWDVPPEVCARSAEEDDRLFLKTVFNDKGIRDGDLDGWVARKQAATVAMLRDCARLYPGVAELVAELRGRFSLGIVSGTWRENITTVLASAGLADAFPTIIAKEDVTRPKPDPSAYRLALKAVGCDGEEAVALEDSPSGLHAARAAGLRVVAVGHRREAGEWSGPAPYVSRLADLNSIVEAIERAPLS